MFNFLNGREKSVQKNVNYYNWHFYVDMRNFCLGFKPLISESFTPLNLQTKI